MPKPIKTPDRLVDRTWRPGHPYRPRLSRHRRIIMIVLFLLLSGMIGAYLYFTNANRVRQQAEDYLARLTGGHVNVGKATLSIFEGLRVEDVRVYTDESKSDDSLIFSASNFLIEYSPGDLLRGQIEATRIVAIEPHVRLCENVQTHEWNYQLLKPRKQKNENTKLPRNLPEISLRNAMVDYLETGKSAPIGSVSIDGQLSPGPNDHYLVKLQSRGENAIGPSANADVDIATGDLDVTVTDLKFAADLRLMLPAQVQNWWSEHALKGRVKTTELRMNPSKSPQNFQAKISLDNVAMTVQPEELLSNDEMQCRAWTTQAFEVMRTAGLDRDGFVGKLSESLEAAPITLEDVTGDFAFTQDGFDIQDLKATIEKNRFLINGHYEGYRNDAKASLKLTNVPGEKLSIPKKPKFLNSLPAEVREAYTRFRPQGTCDVWAEYVRPAAGARPWVTGEVNVADGNFTFEKLPYPICRATGKIAVDRDAKTGEEHLRIEKIRGHGLTGGPNEKAFIEIDGDMGPFTPAIEVNMTVRGKNISTEPALKAAFPPKTRAALAFFDSAGKGEFPTYRGNFTCSIHRLPDRVSHWNIETAIHLDEAAGSLVAFPYPMDHVTGDLVISEDHMQIKEARFKRGDSDLLIKGRVDWASDEQRALNPASQPTLRPALSIVAHNVPIDEPLMNALPPMQNKWLHKLSAKGKFDLSGRLTSAPSSGLDFGFDVALHDCSGWDMGDAYAVTGLNGTLKLTPQKLTLVDLHGKRDQSDVTANGQINWQTSPPQVAMVAEAKNLALDQTLFENLPEAAQKGWTAVHPEGTVDAKVTFTGAPAEDAVASAADVAPSTQPTGQNYELVLTPRNLSITPSPAPYRLDNLTGTVTITPGAIKMQNVTGHHGSAEVRFSGTGPTNPNGVWEFQLAGSKMLVDDDLKKAIPTGLQSVLQSMDLQAEIAFEFSSLKISPDATPNTTPATQDAKPADLAGGTSVVALPEPKSSVDFAVKFTLTDAMLDPGVPLSKVNGTAEFLGATRGGKLTDLGGVFNLSSLEVAGRPTTNLRAELVKRPGQDAMKLAKIQAQMVGGQLAGQIDWTYPDTGPSRYAMALVLHNADVKTLAGETMPDATGALSASLSMDGIFNDPGSRRGGGDVAVNGEQLYKIPLILGLLQITSLALPITSPFNEGACRYTIDGTRVTFESIELRAKEMMVSGSGHMDFDSGRVGMSFTSQSTTNWLKVPVVNDILQGARNELLTIHVRGTIQQPQVSGSSMNTLMTTVDEVFRGGKPPPDLPPVKKRLPKPPK